VRPRNFRPATYCSAELCLLSLPAVAAALKSVKKKKERMLIRERTGMLRLPPCRHDMLINQKFSAANTKGMAYLPRNTGWYRKHFKLPAAWSGKSVWLYIEGSFHATTAFLNGADIGQKTVLLSTFLVK